MVTNFTEHNKHIYRGIYQSLVDVFDPELSKKRLDSMGDYNLFDNIQKIENHLMENKYKGAPLRKIEGESKSFQELFVDIIIGVEPLDAFDSIVESWKQQGGDEMTKEVNAWYLRQSDAKAGNN